MTFTLNPRVNKAVKQDFRTNLTQNTTRGGHLRYQKLGTKNDSNWARWNL